MARTLVKSRKGSEHVLDGSRQVHEFVGLELGHRDYHIGLIQDLCHGQVCFPVYPVASRGGGEVDPGSTRSFTHVGKAARLSVEGRGMEAG